MHVSVQGFLARGGCARASPMSMEACMLSLLKGVFEHPEHPPVSAPGPFLVQKDNLMAM